MSGLNDRTRTQRPRGATGAASDALLFLALRAGDLAAPLLRYALGALERVEVGRGHAPPHTADRSLRVELSDPWLSARHLLFERALGQWTVRDLATKNGTRVNGATTRGGRLDDGDVIERVGQPTPLVIKTVAPPPGRYRAYGMFGLLSLYYAQCCWSDRVQCLVAGPLPDRRCHRRAH